MRAPVPGKSRFAMKQPKCHRYPEKVRFQKAAHAWIRGAYWSKKEGIQLFLYPCECGGWHLTKWSDGPNSTRIDTNATRKDHNDHPDL